MGCFLDNGTNATMRALNGLNLATNIFSNNSQVNCNRYCKNGNFKYSGVENG